MSKTNLQDKVFAIENPIELDRAVEDLRTTLAALSWLTNPYHLAQRFYKNQDGRALYLPETYISTGAGAQKNELYLPMTPNSGVKGRCFFFAGAGTNDYFAHEANFLTYPLSIIFTVNLELIDAEKLKKYLFTQELIREARQILTNATGFSFVYSLLSETRDLREVFREFVIDDVEQYNRAPLQCFRFDLTLKLQEEC